MLITITHRKGTIMQIEDLLEALRQASKMENGSDPQIRTAIEAVLVWLNDPSNNIGENCEKISMFVATRICNDDLTKFPQDVQRILYDMGAGLYDTYKSPAVAANFESTPSQLLKRVQELRD